MPPLETVPWVLYEPEPETGILWIKYNRPERYNSNVGSANMKSSVAKVVEYMQNGDDDPDIRFIVLTGVGRAFCAGNDGQGPRPEEDPGENFPGNRGPKDIIDGTRQGFLYGLTRILREISQIRKPTIAMVNGPAAGSGMDMAMHCDIRIGCENSRFVTYHQRGQIIENGGLYYLPRLIGLGKALEFAYLGDMDAQTAYEWGILNHLVPSEELEQYTRDLIFRMGRISPTTQWINKRIMRAALDSSLETTMVMTSNAAIILNESEDGKEARNAAREKRRPVFKGT